MGAWECAPTASTTRAGPTSPVTSSGSAASISRPKRPGSARTSARDTSARCSTRAGSTDRSDAAQAPADEPMPSGADVSALLDEAEQIVNAAGADLLDEQSPARSQAVLPQEAQAALSARDSMVGSAVPARTHAVERRAIEGVWIAVLFWSANALFVRAGDADPLVFTTWRLWIALPPLAAVLLWRTRRGERCDAARAGCVTRALGADRLRRGRVLRFRRGDRVRGDRQDAPAGRDADRRVAAGRDHRHRGAVPRRARRVART